MSLINNNYKSQKTMDVKFTAQEFAQLDQLISNIPTGYGWQAAYVLTLVKQKNEALAKEEAAKETVANQAEQQKTVPAATSVKKAVPIKPVDPDYLDLD